MSRTTKEDSANIEVQPAVAPEQNDSGATPHAKKHFSRKRKCKIVVDSCGDFSAAIARRIDVEVIGFPYVDESGEEHIDDMWQTADAHEFYEGMRKGAHYHTASVSPGRYAEVFERIVTEEQLPVLYLAFTGGLSSSVYAAEQAAQAVMDEHPGSKVLVLDNLCPSTAAELLAMEVCRLADMGNTVEELYGWAADARYFVHGYFTLEGLDTLAAGGRIPAAAANVGGKLDIKPELSYDTDGSLVLCGMCRGRKKALRAMVAHFLEGYSHDPALPVSIVDADASKDADWLEATIRKNKGCEDLVIIRNTVSPILGTHVGPGMVAITFWGTDRRSKMTLADRIAQKVRGKGDGADA